MQRTTKLIYPILSLFIILSAVIIVLKTRLIAWSFDPTMLLIANAGLLLLTLLVFFMQIKSIRSGNPNRFVQAVMAGTLIKMMLFAISVLVYVRTTEHISRKSVIACLVFYILYLFVEVMIVNRLNKRKNA